MKRTGSSKRAGATGAGPGAPVAKANDALIDSGIATLERATSDDRHGRLEEALTLYETGIDLLLQGARQEPSERRRQFLLREVDVHMSRAESIKAALAPPVPPSPPPRSSLPGGGGVGKAGGRIGGRGTTRGRGKAALSRPIPGASDIRGTARGSGTRRKALASDRGNHSLDSSGTTTYSSVGVGAGGRGGFGAGRGAGKGGGRGGGGLLRKEPSENSELEERILEDMLDRSPRVSWDSIAGLEYVKQTLQETVILPNLRPDLFTGLRAPAKGVLLYGPPGTGKTMMAKAVATESGYAFFNISASSLTSKYVGEGEKMVRALFSAARQRQPAVIFIDEIDSVLSARGEGEHEASRRLKTEFLVQLDGVGSAGGDGERVSLVGAGGDERLLVLAATNLPQELDEAALRRLSRRIYVPLPDPAARSNLLARLLSQHKANVKGASLTALVEMTEGYSGSDLKELCKEAAMQPIRDLGAKVRTVAAKDVRAIKLSDFEAALPRVRPSVSKKTADRYEEWERSLSGL